MNNIFSGKVFFSQNYLKVTEYNRHLRKAKEIFLNYYYIKVHPIQGTKTVKVKGYSQQNGNSE